MDARAARHIASIDGGAEAVPRAPAAPPTPAAASRAHLARDQAAERRQALAAFLRSRRERVTPEMVGLPPGLRRRTPGLRREEVALLAGVGVTWYTWLEQGRPINASAQVLGAVARVLRLDQHERSHVFTLADVADPDAEAPFPAMTPGIQTVLDQLDPFPAAVFSARSDIVLANANHARLLGDYHSLPRRYRNSLWLFFTDPVMREMNVEWDKASKRMVAQFRSQMADHYGEPAWRELLDLLCAHSDLFRELWDRQEVAAMDGCFKTFIHPDVGELRIEVSHMWLADQPELRLTTYSPRDARTRARMEQLHEATPRRLATPPPTDRRRSTGHDRIRLVHTA